MIQTFRCQCARALRQRCCALGSSAPYIHASVIEHAYHAWGPKNTLAGQDNQLAIIHAAQEAGCLRWGVRRGPAADLDHPRRMAHVLSVS